MTINQALDQIFTSYQKKNISDYPAVQLLRQHLIELKMVWGGNTKVENEKTVKSVIKHGTANPDSWS